MHACDAIIVGGGPAGSTCAWCLAREGLRVTIIDQAVFPRDKPCAGWITPRVLDLLGLSPQDYPRDHVMQAIFGFKVSLLGSSQTQVAYDHPVSYGILRREFDAFLLARSGAEVVEGTPVTSIERDGLSWIVNGGFCAHFLVGAGGHFCPVARHLGASPNTEAAVVAREAEFHLTRDQRLACGVHPERPELFFLPDLSGYAWCFRKGDWLNVGIGTLDRHSLNARLDEFLSHLSTTGKLPFDVPVPFKGHAYLLAATSRRASAPDAFLIGDAAGLARSESGEGILPAVESGREAAQAILDHLSTLPRTHPPHLSAAWLPAPVRRAAARYCLSRPALARTAINRLFLHAA